MKLLDSLYSIIRDRATDAEHSYAIRLNPEHFIYAAHFPGEPITPGVCIMQIAQELISLHLAKAVDIKCVKNIKFLNVITPTKSPEVIFTLQKIGVEDGCVKAQVVVMDDDTTYAKLSLVCQINA